MDFFQYQADAKRNTFWLYILFGIALFVIVIAVYASVTVSMYLLPLVAKNMHVPSQFWEWQRFFYVSLATTLFIVAGSWHKIHQLKKGGGIAIAEMLGGQRLRNPKDPQERQLRNIIEEMAVASGMPTPAIYLLEQQSINAFAAGYEPKDMVVAVTHGALEMLNRDELQGVVAHEFSHLLHGDTLLKMKMMGLLHGITMISDLGILMISGRNTVSHSNYKGGSHPVLMLSGLLFFTVGLVGMLAADMIKAAMSRQREFLADAAAVQFTRNPDGIGNALKVMGGYKAGSMLKLPDVQQVSHLFFGDALQSWWQSNWWATHPPLVKRIQRIDPSFRGNIEKVNEARVRAFNQEQANMFFASPPTVEQLQMNVQQVMQSVGEPTSENLQQAQGLLAKIPEEIHANLYDVFVAKGMVYNLLLSSDRALLRKQSAIISGHDSSQALAQTIRIRNMMPQVASELKLPILDIVSTHLAELTNKEQRTFLETLKKLIAADSKVSLFEYLLYQVFLYKYGLLKRHNFGQFIPLERMEGEVELLLNLVCSVNKENKPQHVKQEALKKLFPSFVSEKTITRPKVNHVVKALEKLNVCSFADKKRLLEAVVFCVLSDGLVGMKEIETMRLIALMLGCPMPLLNPSRIQ